jgi:biopolymer transport protein ExbD
MITRPLELAAQLRPVPRNFDALFYVNVGLLALFFVLFGSAFVLSPSVGIDFQLPQAAGANRNQAPFTHRITVVSAGQIFAGDGVRSLPEVRKWLQEKARSVKRPSLLIIAGSDVALSLVADITGEATAAGFVQVQVSAIEPNSGAPSPSR